MKTSRLKLAIVAVLSCACLLPARAGLFKGTRTVEEGEVDPSMYTVIKPDAALPASMGPGDYRRNINVGDLERFYDIHVPPQYKAGTPMPMVVNFHGRMGNPVQQRNDTHMNRVADEKGFIVIYPAGTAGMTRERFLTWNVDRGDSYAVSKKIDDNGFVKAALADVAKGLTVDKKRVYAMGFSQGGAYTYKVSCELSDQFAAIATVGAVMLVPMDQCKPSHPMPLINFQAVHDPLCIYQGGVYEKGGDPLPRPGAKDMIAYWVKRSGLPPTPSETKTVGDCDYEHYGPAKDGAEVVSWTMKTGGHTWPGGDSTLPTRMVGDINKDISASDLIWEFFQKHALP